MAKLKNIDLHRKNIYSQFQSSSELFVKYLECSNLIMAGILLHMIISFWLFSNAHIVQFQHRKKIILIKQWEVGDFYR